MDRLIIVVNNEEIDPAIVPAIRNVFLGLVCRDAKKPSKQESLELYRSSVFTVPACNEHAFNSCPVKSAGRPMKIID